MKRSLLVVCLLASALAVPAHADTVYSNLGPAPNLYSDTSGYLIASSDTFLGAFSQGFRFNSGATGTLSQIELGVGALNGYAGTFTVALWADGDSTVGSPLGSWDFTTSMLWGSSSSTLTTIATPNGPALAAGTSYILTLSARETNVILSWGNTNALQTNYFSQNGGPWQKDVITTVGATRLTSIPLSPVNSVPEPTSILTLAGVAVLAVGRRRL